MAALGEEELTLHPFNGTQREIKATEHKNRSICGVVSWVVEVVLELCGR